METTKGSFVQIYRGCETMSRNSNNHLGFAAACFVKRFKPDFDRIVEEEEMKQLDLCMKVDGKGNVDYKETTTANGVTKEYKYTVENQKILESWMRERNREAIALDDSLIEECKLNKERHRKYWSKQVITSANFEILNGILFDDDYFEMLEWVEEEDKKKAQQKSI